MFSLLVLVGALGALSFEMIEDSFVNLIYARMFGWRTFFAALLVATLLVVPTSAAFVLFAPSLFASYLSWIEKSGALLLMAIGIGWLGFAVATKENELEETRKAVSGLRSAGRSLALASQLVAVEEAEIVVILIPLVFDMHVVEASVAAVAGVGVALGVALALRRRFARLVEGRFRQLKMASGTALFFLGLVLLLT